MPNFIKDFSKNADIHVEIIYKGNVVNISEFLKNLKAGIEVPQNWLFLKVYDKDNNSVFDEKEIKKLKKDISVFAAEDNNKEDLSDDEALDFFNKKMLEINPNFKEIKGSTDIMNGGSLIASQAVGLVKGWFNQFKDKHINAYNRLQSDIRYQKLSESMKNIATIMLEFSIKYNLDVENDEDVDDYSGQFEGGGMVETVYKEIEVIFDALEHENISEEDADKIFKNVKELSKLPNFQISPYDIKNYIDYPTENIEYIVQNNMFLGNRWNCDVIRDMEILLKTDRKSLERYGALKNVDVKNSPYHSKKLITLDDDLFQNVLEIKANTLLNKNKQLAYEEDIIELAKLGKNAIQMAIDILSNPDLKDIEWFNHSPARLVDFVKQPKKIEYLVQFKNAELALGIENDEQSNHIQNIMTMINSSNTIEKEDYENYLFELEKFDIENPNLLQNILNTEIKSKDGKNIQLHSQHIIFYGENFDNLKVLLNSTNAASIYQEDGIYLFGRIAKNPNSDFYKFIVQNPDFKFKSQGLIENGTKILYTPENPILKYVFDSENFELIETQEKISESNDANKYLIKTISKKNNIEQLTEFTNTPQGKLVTKDVVKYYNLDGTLNKTVTSSPSNIDGIMNQSVTYPDGSVKPLQFVSQQDGNTIIEKHFTSPLGTTTDYHNEETADGIRIIDYTIKKGDEILLDKHYTFQQIDENHILSSVNGVPYDVIFDGKKIIITNKQDNTQHIIDLTDKIGENNREMIFSVLKKMPPDRLMIINQRDLTKIQYDEKEKYNAAWDYGDKTIKIGDFSESDSDEVSIEKLFAVFMHEFGHFIDLPQKRDVKISKNSEIKQTFKAELEAYKKQSTKTQQDYIDYLINPNADTYLHVSEPLQEALGDAEMSIFASDLPLQLRMRLLEYQANFPELIAKYINACDEQVK